jgi:hypothetical protein
VKEEPVAVTPPPAEPPILYTEQKPKKPAIERPLKVMNHISYKEVSQRGGQKWFIGEPEEIAVARREARKLALLNREEGSDGGEASDVLMVVSDEPQLPAVATPAAVPAVKPVGEDALTVATPAVSPAVASPDPAVPSTEHTANRGVPTRSAPFASQKNDSAPLHEGKSISL